MSVSRFGSCSRVRRSFASTQQRSKSDDCAHDRRCEILFYGTLAQNHLKGRRCAAAYQAQVHCRADAFRTEHMQDIADAIDRLTVPASDNVTHKQPGPLGGPLRIRSTSKTPRPLLDVDELSCRRSCLTGRRPARNSRKERYAMSTLAVLRASFSSLARELSIEKQLRCSDGLPTRTMASA